MSVAHSPARWRALGLAVMSALVLLGAAPTAAASDGAGRAVSPALNTPSEPGEQFLVVPALVGPLPLDAQVGVDVPNEPPRTAVIIPPARPRLNPETHFRRGLVPLFASYAVLQALDVHSTLTVIARGGSERNALIAPVVNRPAAFIALKAGFTAATFLAADRLSRRNAVAAYALMFAVNTAYAVVVAHNYQIARSTR